MTILIDDARVPAHDRFWCHLASDTSFEELHAFVTPFGIPERGFDGDHYDVPRRTSRRVHRGGSGRRHVEGVGTGTAFAQDYVDVDHAARSVAS